MEDAYFTLKHASEGEYREKGSKFFAFAWPVGDLDEVEAHLAATRKRFHDARHVCYAYRLGPTGATWRANDDGEPGHSAGDPILHALKRNEVTNACIAVVRYFGGTKLGISGLIRAYGTAAEDAVAHNTVIEILITERLSIRYPYTLTSEVNRVLHKFKLKATESVYESDTLQHFDIRTTEYEKIALVFREMGIIMETDK